MMSNEGAAWQGYYVYSPSSSYPNPTATLIDSVGTVHHEWSNPTDQLPVEQDPPTYLRGWNHVHVDADGCLFAIVPLCSLLKLGSESELMWRADLAAHHDLHVSANGTISVLAEVPRRIGDHVMLDNEIVVLDRFGTQLHAHSLYETLDTDCALGELIAVRLSEQHAAYAGCGIEPDTATRELLTTGQADAPIREALRMLRELPGSPCDVLHGNALSVLHAHASGLWGDGDVLVSLRSLDTIAVVDLRAGQRVRLFCLDLQIGQHLWRATDADSDAADFGEVRADVVGHGALRVSARAAPTEDLQANQS